jgi:hypothetical protein
MRPPLLVKVTMIDLLEIREENGVNRVNHGGESAGV